MQDRKRISTAIANAIIDLPVDVCRIVADYAIRRSHTFNNQNEATSVDVKTNGNETEFRLDADPFNTAWTSFISDTNLADGHLRWSVEIQFRTGTAEMVVGLAVADEIGYSIRAYGSVTDQNGGLIESAKIERIDIDETSFVLTTPSLPYDRLSNRLSTLHLWFDADPAAGIVYTGWIADDLELSDAASIDAWFVSPTAFASIRPYISLQGPGRIVLRSGDDDWPSTDRYRSAIFCKTV